MVRRKMIKELFGPRKVKEYQENVVFHSIPAPLRCNLDTRVRGGACPWKLRAQEMINNELRMLGMHKHEIGVRRKLIKN